MNLSLGLGSRCAPSKAEWGTAPVETCYRPATGKRMKASVPVFAKSDRTSLSGVVFTLGLSLKPTSMKEVMISAICTASLESCPQGIAKTLQLDYRSGFRPVVNNTEKTSRTPPGPLCAWSPLNSSDL